MSVRAKFSVYSKKEVVGAVEVEMSPVFGDSGENKQFWSATPSGKITLYITNPDAAEHFQVGKPYYVDFTPAD